MLKPGMPVSSLNLPICSSTTSQTATLQPSFCNRLAMAAPSPRVPPVTNATRAIEFLRLDLV
jgi:hypothetical protein